MNKFFFKKKKKKRIPQLNTFGKSEAQGPAGLRTWGRQDSSGSRAGRCAPLPRTARGRDQRAAHDKRHSLNCFDGGFFGEGAEGAEKEAIAGLDPA